MPAYAVARGNVGRLMRALSGRQQMIVLLRAEHDDWTQGDIAAELGISQPAVCRHMQRIMQIACEIYGVTL